MDFGGNGIRTLSRMKLSFLFHSSIIIFFNFEFKYSLFNSYAWILESLTSAIQISTLTLSVFRIIFAWQLVIKADEFGHNGISILWYLYQS